VVQRLWALLYPQQSEHGIICFGNYLKTRRTGVSPVSHMGILPMFRGLCTGGTPVRLMGKMPMLRFEIVS
jgi:hypothetical protein